MNKVFALVLSAMLASTMGTAFAASPIEFEGYVNVFHETLSNFERAPGGYVTDRDNFFSNKLQINVTFRPNDQVSVFWQFRGPNYQRWGVTEYAPNINNPRDNTNIFTRALYGEVVFPWGTIRGGRIVDGLAGTAGGLASLGYNPQWGSEFLYANPFDRGDPLDSLTYTNKWDNGFGIAVFYGKMASYWGDDPSNYNLPINNPWNNYNTEFKDNDYDIFGVEGSYEWDGGGATLGIEYHRDMTSPYVEKSYAIFVNPSIYQSWGAFAVHFEAVFAWGKETRSRYINGTPQYTPNQSNVFKSAGLGLYLDGVYNYGSGDITLATWFVDGTGIKGDGTVEDKNHSLVSLGDFAPFLVAFNDVTLGNGFHSNNLGWGGYGTAYATGRTIPNRDWNYGTTNQWGIGILGNHNITPEIKLNYGLGYFRLVQPTFRIDISNVGAADRRWYYQSKDLGWEIDLGATFQILDNLSFETQFGYMFNGKAYDYPIYDGTVFRGMAKAKDTFAWANVLSFTF